MCLITEFILLILFVEFLAFILKNMYSLSEEQKQCADCKYLRYIDTISCFKI